jgi:hypothetical protein
MAITTVVTTDSIEVLGPPVSVDVQVDLGAQGDRGSIFYSGFGDPNVVTDFYTPGVNSPNVGDLYIRRDLGANYGVVYKYNVVPNGTVWESILRFQPVTYADTVRVDFSNGVGSIGILASDFYVNASANMTAESIVLSMIPNNEYPVFLSIISKEFKSINSQQFFVANVAAHLGLGALLEGGEVNTVSGSMNVDFTLSLKK